MAAPPTPLEPSCDVRGPRRHRFDCDSARRKRLRNRSDYSAAIFGMLGRLVVFEHVARRLTRRGGRKSRKGAPVRDV